MQKDRPEIYKTALLIIQNYYVNSIFNLFDNTNVFDIFLLDQTLGLEMMRSDDICLVMTQVRIQ